MTETIAVTTTTCPKDTPWGRADGIKQIAPGFWQVYTPGHGGWYVAPELWNSMPEDVKQTPYSKNGWFEEDCDWAILCLYFWDRIALTLESSGFTKDKTETRQAAISTVKHSYDGRFYLRLIGHGRIGEVE